MRRMTANLLMLVAGLVWGVGFVAQETAMESIGPFLFMGMRFFIATLALLPLVWLERKALTVKEQNTKLDTSAWRSLGLVGCVFFIAMALQQVGLLATSVTNAGILTGLYVVLVPIIIRVFYGEHQSIIIWASAMAAFFGIWLLGGGGLERLTWGDWLIIVSALFMALHLIFIGATVGKLRLPATLAATQFAIASLLSWIGYALSRSLEWQSEPPVSIDILIQAAPEILYAALLAGALAFMIMAFCQQYTKASDAAIILSSEALFAALGGAILLGERLDLSGYIGCLILFLAITATSFAAAKAEEQDRT